MLPGRFLYDSMFGLDRVEDMSCDIYEKDSKYHLEMDIPGFTKDDIKIECHKGTITVSAKKNVEKEEKDEDKKYIRRERKYGEYKRYECNHKRYKANKNKEVEKKTTIEYLHALKKEG